MILKFDDYEVPTNIPARFIDKVKDINSIITVKIPSTPYTMNGSKQEISITIFNIVETYDEVKLLLDKG